MYTAVETEDWVRDDWPQWIDHLCGTFMHKILSPLQAANLVSNSSIFEKDIVCITF